MKRSTRYFLIVIGVLSIMSGIYSIIIKGDVSDIIFGLVIGASLIGSVYFDKSGSKSTP